ncbi:MAG TPA: hypothetical protein GX708_20940 [Gallicola sp.]|jgi:hypothetical protein|nr:hypothetical protein [Gallicola sp.]
MSYEYVPRSEYTPVREILEEIIRKVQYHMKPEYTFQFVLIGSGRKKLITREKGSNKGFDFDYNFVLQNVYEDYNEPVDIRQNFFNIIQEVSKDYGYKTEDSTTSITIKLVDQDNKKIVHSCDIAIVEEIEDENDVTSQWVYVRDKSKNKPSYTLRERPNSYRYNNKISDIEGAGLWNELRDEYLKIKNKNHDSNKKSFQLFIEAINNVYNRYEWNE